MSSKFIELQKFWKKRREQDPTDLFIDHEFPASLKSLVYLKSHNCQSQSLHQDILDSKVTWRRPHDICDRIGRKPRFVVRGAKTYDLNQGQIGNCWFVAGATHLALRPELFQQVVPKDQEFDDNYAGIFHFYFWRFGEWKEVIVDDLLPYDNSRQSLFFLLNPEEPNEFWAALMEKAFAKLHTCYESLHGGFTGDSMVDISGGIAQHIELQGEVPDDLFATMLRNNRLNTLFACAIFTAREMEERRPDGLVALHAYCITDIQQVKDRNGRSHELLKLRNPWGGWEWTGDWSDKSSLWSLISTENKRRLTQDKDDGEFWMSFHDWFAAFEEVQMCFIPPNVNSGGKRNWEQETHYGTWVRGISAGGSNNATDSYWRNPQITVTLTDPDPDDRDEKSTMIVSLMKQDRRKLTLNFDRLPINFDIYQLGDDKPDDLSREDQRRRASYVASASRVATMRRELVFRAKLKPGRYVIIPYTHFKDVSAKFVLRVFTEKPASKGILDHPTGPIVIPESSNQELLQVFDSHCGSDRLVDYLELVHFLNQCFDKGVAQSNRFTREVTRSLIAMFDPDQSGRLTFDECNKMVTELEVWRSAFSQFDRDRSNTIDIEELQAVFKLIGFSVSRTLLQIIAVRYSGRDGQISFNEFLALFAKLTTYYGLFKRHRSEDGDRILLSLDEFLGLVL